MSNKRIEAKAIRERADAARAEAEIKAAVDFKHAKRMQQLIGANAKQALQAACEGVQCVRLDTDSYDELSDLMILNGFSVVGVGYIRKKFLEFQQVAITHRSEIEKAINDSSEISDFLWSTQVSSSAKTSIGKLLKLLDQAHKAWVQDQYPRNRGYFINFLNETKQQPDKSNLTPNRVLVEIFEQVWVEYVWYESALQDAAIYEKDIQAVGKAGDSEIYAVWHDAKETVEGFKEQMPTAGFLKWLSEKDGQKLLNKIDEQISECADLGKTEVNITISKKERTTYWSIDYEDLPGPSPALFAKVMLLRGFKIKVAGDNEVTLSW